jgi:hypothetical protein
MFISFWILVPLVVLALIGVFAIWAVVSPPPPSIFDF